LPSEDRGVIPVDVEDLVMLQAAIEGLGEHRIWGHQGVEGPGTKGDGGVDIKVHTVQSEGLAFECCIRNVNYHIQQALLRRGRGGSKERDSLQIQAKMA